MTQLKLYSTVVLTSILIFFGTVCGVAICEIGLRIAGIEYPYFSIIDDTRGWAYQPGVSGWNRREGESYVQINSEGFFDREHTKVKPENTLRIAILGDSFVDAQHVPFEQGFASVTLRELSKSKALSGQNVEVMKFGVGGYGTDQELITLRQQVWNYAPDLVILAVFTQNDIINNSQYLENLVYKDSTSPKPTFIIKDGELVLKNSFLDKNDYQLRRSWWYKTYATVRAHSRLVQAFNQLKYVFSTPYEKVKLRDIEHGELGFDDAIYQQTTDSIWEEAWHVTEEIIRTMHREVTAKGADFLVVTLSNDLQVLPDPLLRQKAMQILGVSDLFYPDKRIKALSDRQGFPVLNLAPSFQFYAEKNNICLHGFDNAVPCGGHWNAQGHQLAGKIIAEKICENLNLKKNDSIHQKNLNKLTT